ncbi:LytR/AlgR family response regulator transcription factor [Chitinophaga nivalis]|uniref:LytTR family DNA-binding domain-containing protein n=1 Tax=Chitinophaga nivalis TaxID=2991709 RepID=A0ABT3IGQ9_9BACT|nr:LytTR family DNA-binding domain-containing protein [Chitinophaga nivalis]MCW3467156.1 LytTR family DNA-binding domain-containing protein [Chitinophaga nivalis]MCW3483152.1 LytTR family DNA-binding domain-containing protein [Chitinophaga nivalis]
MRVVIIEDEKLSATRLKNMLFEISPDIEVLAMIDTITDSVAWFREHSHPDVALMDIRLADGLSFDIMTQTKLACPVIFTTAYDEYAIRAFKVNSIDYLLKPIEKDDLQQALEKVGSLQSQADPNTVVQQLLEFFKQKDITYRTRFLLPFRDGYKTVLVEDIDFVYSSFRITHLVLKDGSQETVAQTMDDLEEQLNPANFFRANRQHLISIQSIGSIHNYFNGKLKITLKRDPERELLISKEKAPAFKQWLDR